MRCPSCGNDNPDEFPFCIECGARVDPMGPRQPPPSDPHQGYDDSRRGYDEHAPAYDDRRPAYDDRRPAYDERPPAYDDRRPGGYDRPPAYDDRGGHAPPEPAPPQPTARAARLILESGLGKQEYSLEAPVVTIGRSRSNDISLDDARISRHHARIVRGDGGYLIEDLNSRNGTRVGDRAVRDSAPLEDGALIKVGDAVFRFVIAAPAAPAPAPMPSRQPEPYRSAEAAPVVFQPPWSPVQCPKCQGMGTMRPIIYGPAAADRAAQEAARRGEVALSEGPARPDGPNAECRSCGMRVRIVATSS